MHSNSVPEPALDLGQMSWMGNQMEAMGHVPTLPRKAVSRPHLYLMAHGIEIRDKGGPWAVMGATLPPSECPAASSLSGWPLEALVTTMSPCVGRDTLMLWALSPPGANKRLHGQ